MKISLLSLDLKNFRGYRDAHITFDEHLNVIIGRNDVGKSTILEALEIFFNGNQIKIDPSDRNVHCSQDEKIEMTCCFKLKDDAQIIVDTSVPIRLDQEFLLNASGNLEIHKTWDCSKNTITAKDVKTYIVADYPVLGTEPIICQKIAALKTLLKDKVSEEQYDAVDKTKASEIRKALYETVVDENTSFAKTEIDTTQEGTKNIWASLQSSLPLYFLFKADRLNSDKDSEVQTPMKAVTKTVIAGMQDRIEEMVSQVKEQVERIGRETITKLGDLDPEIASTLSPKVTVKPMESLFNFDLMSDDNIPINKRGSGVRRLILLSYFRAEAEKNLGTDHNNSVIYAIEEPETAQHPDYQKMIIETLQDLSKDEIHQIIITTHTPEIARMVELPQLIFINKDEAGMPYSEVDPDTKYQQIVSSLGILPFAAEQCVICVEGLNDVNFLSAINKIPEFNAIVNLEAEKIRIIPMYGSSLTNWVQSNYFRESNIREIHFYDNDRQDYRDIANQINREKDNRRVAFLTTRREMENYIPPKRIEEEFGGLDLSEYSEKWETMDIPRLLADKVMLHIVDRKQRLNTIKTMLNKSTSTRISANDLREIGVYDELFALFTNIKSFAHGTYTY